MLKIALVAVSGIVIAVLAILAYATTRPDTFRVERSVTINAAPERIFPLINDFRAWAAWSPYETMDTNLKKEYGAITTGRGATYGWEGDKTGRGRMEITEAAAPRKIVIKLDFIKPFEANNIAEFTLAPGAGGTNVTWAMHGPALFVGKAMGLFMDMDNMVGKDFAKGLQNLKALAEKP